MAVELRFAFRLLHLRYAPIPMILIPIRYKIRQDWLRDLTCLNSKVKIKTITTEQFKRTTAPLPTRKKKLLSFNTYEIFCPTVVILVLIGY